MTDCDVTVVTPARNAAATIARAMRTAVGARVREIVLVDHASTDETVALAREVAPHPLRVVQADAALRLGGVRQAGVDAVETEFMVWLDADDEFLPGRVDRLVPHLDAGADLVADGVELQDTEGARRVLPIPGFLRRAGGAVRLFERNYLPGPGVVGARVARLREVRYDPRQHGPEDTDVLLRAIDAGARLAFEPTPGYRIHALPTSLSRDMTNQRTMYRALLLKHHPERVRALYAAAGWSLRVTGWALYSIAMFVADLAAARAHLDAIARLDDGVGDGDVSEPDGPMPVPEGWRLAFASGTLSLLAGDAAGAIGELERAEATWPSAEGANNLGVALTRNGQLARARELFAVAVARRPDYVDAVVNRRVERPERITSHPLRHHANRSDYSAA
ncbi:glycosyltransferase [Luteitalea sp.]|uniref:glycosyltransferase n=1 Tax=Luteitalea sp. TaxID=2004800 RepID=UPI0037C9949D